MQLAFHISATFLTGRYHGEEWPPSPARLLQALVSAAHTGRNRTIWPSIKEGLLWLEQQAAPNIRTRTQQPLSTYKIAVPNNDFDVVAKEWAAGRPADPSKLRTLKDIKPRAIDYAEVTPHVQYTWHVDESDSALKAARSLLPAIHSLYSLGWGIDMAFADCVIGEDNTTSGWIEWIPSNRGEQLAVPVPGFLEDLGATYRRFVARSSGKGVDTDTRPSVYRLQRYERTGLNRPPYATFGLRTLDDEDTFSQPWEKLVEIAAWVRHAAGQYLTNEILGESITAYVFGHPENSADANHRLSYIPIPSIHPFRADARVRRIMVTEPIGTTGHVTGILTSKWRAAVLKKDGRDICLLSPREDSVTALYTGVGTRWNSVTPVILHGHNATHGAVSLTKTEKLLLRAFAMAGRPDSIIKSLAFQNAPLWPGTGAATSIRVPGHLENYPRYHVQVNFREPVAGPLLAGIGRHFGLGVFAVSR
jgi:CRISPR-associated protein Csb2